MDWKSPALSVFLDVSKSSSDAVDGENTRRSHRGDLLMTVASLRFESLLFYIGWFESGQTLMGRLLFPELFGSPAAAMNDEYAEEDDCVFGSDASDRGKASGPMSAGTKGDALLKQGMAMKRCRRLC